MPDFSAQNVIEAENLTRIYTFGQTRVTGLDAVSFMVKPGEMVVLKGESGSGKSTLLSLLAGLDRPTSGRLKVAGHDLSRLSLKKLTQFRRQKVGMVFQTFNLLPTLTVMENVCLPALLAGNPADKTAHLAGQYLNWLGISDKSDRFPSRLSGGEMQRCAIARALINQPEIILADEPTGNLDSKNGKAVIELFTALNEKWGTTVIIATHGSLADQTASRGIRLKDGRLDFSP